MLSQQNQEMCHFSNLVVSGAHNYALLLCHVTCCVVHCKHVVYFTVCVCHNSGVILANSVYCHEYQVHALLQTHVYVPPYHVVIGNLT